MSRWRITFAAMVGTAGLFGCKEAPKPGAAAPQPSVDAQMATPASAAQARPPIKAVDLQTKAAQFFQRADELPGRNEAEHRATVAALFADLSELLPQLEGPNPDGQFRQDLLTVQTTRSQLAGGSNALAVEPTEDTGLRSAIGALNGINVRSFADRPEIGKSLSDLGATVDDLDKERGPMHRQAVRETALGIARVLRQMADVTASRSGAPTGPPATAPTPKGGGFGPPTSS